MQLVDTGNKRTPPQLKKQGEEAEGQGRTNLACITIFSSQSPIINLL
ncbi:hypothetical protein NSP_21680 [Nodularia spumigena CCY9414]|nr:hypothetical protein NSP_21680 [Nodularia spumigena CCY9414]